MAALVDKQIWLSYLHDVIILQCEKALLIVAPIQQLAFALQYC